MTTGNPPGRPKGPPTYPVSIRMSAQQKATYLRCGGAKWIKRFIDSILPAKKKPP